jgi:hypothetical protein
MHQVRKSFLPAALAAVLGVHSGVSAANPPVKLKTAQVTVSVADHASGETELAAFVPTHARGNCLLTLAESTFPTPGTTVFCGIREVDGVSGVVIHMFLPEAPPPDAFWLVNVYQVGARRYDTPVACDGNC